MSDRRPAAGRRPVSNPYRVSERAPYRAEPPTVQFMVRRLADMFPRSSGRDPGFPVVVTPEGAERDVIAALPRSGHADRHVADAITAFVEDATADLLDGAAYLDIALSDVEKDGRAAGFRVHLIPAQSVRKRRGKYVQEIIDRDDDGEIRRCVVRLDKRWIVPIRLPKDLRKDISRAKEMLRAVDDHHYRRMPNLLRHDSLAAGRFDLTAYTTLVDDALLRRTRALGWDGFVTTSEGLLVPHRAWRALRLARVQVRLRDLLITGLQEAFSVASAAVTTPLSFRVDGLTQLADLDDLEDALADGRRPLSEMFRALHRSDPH